MTMNGHDPPRPGSAMVRNLLGRGRNNDVKNNYGTVAIVPERAGVKGPDARPIIEHFIDKLKILLHNISRAAHPNPLLMPGKGPWAAERANRAGASRGGKARRGQRGKRPPHPGG
jgi:hypothetical protein